MSTLIKPGEPLVGAEAVREVTGPGGGGQIWQKMIALNGHGPNRSMIEGGPILPGAEADRIEALPTTADVENDGDRGVAPHRVRLQKLDAATVNLDARSLDVLLWIASQLPAAKLRTACEEATARGWVRPDARHVEVPVGPEDRARAELLGVVRTIEGLLFRDAEGKPAVTPRRSREEVLADAAARGAGGGE